MLRELILWGRPALGCRSDCLPLDNDTMANPAWETAALRILICRLSPSKDVEESATHLVLYRRLRSRHPGAWLDFSFLPGHKDREILKKHHQALLFGTRSFRGAADFDIVLVSVSTVLEFLNLMPALEASGIPAQADERRFPGTGSGRGGSGDSAGQPWPLILAGGSAALMAQGLVPVVDGLYTGDFETLPEDFHQIIKDWAARQRGSRDPREEQERPASAASLLDRLWAIPGMAGQGIQGSPAPLAGPDILSTDCTIMPVPNNSQAGTLRLMVTQGCPFRCSFCFEGSVRKPYAEAPASDLVAAAKELKIASGAWSVDLLSFNFNTHKDIFALCQGLQEDFAHVHLMSQRLDILQASPDLLRLEAALGKRSFTLGIEGISQRMRRFYSKDLSEASLSAISRELMLSGAGEIKYFFIISGYESDSDLQEFAGFVAACSQARTTLGSRCTLLFSFGFLSVMPHTPLQFLPLRLDSAPLEALAARLRQLVEPAGCEFRLAFDVLQWRLAQVLAMASPALAFQILKASFQAGIWWDSGLPGRSREVLTGCDLPEAAWEGGWTVGNTQPMAIFLQPGRQDQLARQWQAVAPLLGRPGLEAPATQFEGGSSPGQTAPGNPPSLRPASAPERATGSGAARQALLRQVQERSEARKHCPSLWLRAGWGPGQAGASLPWLETWLARSLNALVPELRPWLLRVHERLFSQDLIPPPGIGWYGESLWQVVLKEDAPLTQLESALDKGSPALGTGRSWSLVADFGGPRGTPGTELSARLGPVTWKLWCTGNREGLQKACQQAFAKSHSPAVMTRSPQGGYRWEAAGKQAKKARLKAVTMEAAGGAGTVEGLAVPGALAPPRPEACGTWALVVSSHPGLALDDLLRLLPPLETFPGLQLDLES